MEEILALSAWARLLEGSCSSGLSLAGFHRMARRLPLFKATEESAGVRHAELSQRERRTGARFLGRSTAVRDDGFSKTPQPFDIGLHRLKRNRHSAWNMTGRETVLTPNVHNRDGSL